MVVKALLGSIVAFWATSASLSSSSSVEEGSFEKATTRADTTSSLSSEESYDFDIATNPILTSEEISTLDGLIQKRKDALSKHFPLMNLPEPDQ